MATSRDTCMRDRLEGRPAFQAITDGGQCKCLHCFKELGYFSREKGRVPILTYARPCEKHALLHPTAYNIGQWSLSLMGLERVYTQKPLGGLAVLWVDEAMLGQIDVQLLRQDNKTDRAAATAVPRPPPSWIQPRDWIIGGTASWTSRKRPWLWPSPWTLNFIEGGMAPSAPPPIVMPMLRRSDSIFVDGWGGV